MRFGGTRLLLCVSLLALASARPAAAITIAASDSGWHSSGGNHTATNQNYAAGWVGSEELRNFFVFDLSALPNAPIAWATFRAYNPAVCEPDCSYTGGYASPDASETYLLREVALPAVLVTAPTIANTLVYDDLGDGDVFGSYSASLADNGRFIEIALNASGLAALQGALGSAEFVLGGHVSTLSSSFGVEEIVWGDTDVQGVGPYTRELVIEFVPEPGTGALLGFGLAIAGAARRRAAAGRLL